MENYIDDRDSDERNVDDCETVKLYDDNPARLNFLFAVILIVQLRPG